MPSRPTFQGRRKSLDHKYGEVENSHSKWLPDEVMEIILEYMTTDQQRDMHDYYRRIQDLSALCRTSRQLYRIAMPYLWSRICLDTLSWSGVKLFLRSVLLHPRCSELVTELLIKTLPRDQTRHHRGLHHSRRKPYLQLCLKAIRASTCGKRLKRQLELAISAQHWFADMSAPATHADRQWYVDAELVLILSSCKHIERLEIDVSPAIFKQHIGSPRGADTRMRLTTQYMFQQASGPSFQHLRHFAIAYNQGSAREQALSTQELANILSLGAIESCRITGLSIDVSDLMRVNKVATMREMVFRNVYLETQSLSVLISLYPNLTSLDIDELQDFAAMDLDMILFGYLLRDSCTQIKVLLLQGLQTIRHSHTLIGSLQPLQQLTHFALPFASFFDSMRPPSPHHPDLRLLAMLPSSLEYLHLYNSEDFHYYALGYLETSVMSLAASEITHPRLQHIRLKLTSHLEQEDWENAPELRRWTVDTFENLRESLGFFMTVRTSIVLCRRFTA